MTIPAYLPYFVFAGTAATLFAILYGLHRSLVEAKWPQRIAHGRSAPLPPFSSAGSPSPSGSGHLASIMSTSTEVPTIQYAILLPIVVGALLIWRSETAKASSPPCRNHGSSACNSIAHWA